MTAYQEWLATLNPGDSWHCVDADELQLTSAGRALAGNLRKAEAE